MPRRDSRIEGWKYCAGFCERPLDLSEYYLRLDGVPESKCKQCRRVYTREKYRNKYRKDREFRKREIARVVEAYRKRELNGTR